MDHRRVECRQNKSDTLHLGMLSMLVMSGNLFLANLPTDLRVNKVNLVVKVVIPVENEG